MTYDSKSPLKHPDFPDILQVKQLKNAKDMTLAVVAQEALVQDVVLSPHRPV